MDNRLSKITIVLFVLSFIMTAIGGTFAWLSASANITNGTYTAMTHCFLVDYNIDNGDGTQDITGTMFPSANALGGLNGRVGLKINDSCELYGTGTLKLHINSETSNVLTTSIASYCESRKTLEKIDGITTKEACTTANGRWMGYGDSYCENPTTLERMKDYTTQSDCTTNGGTWTTGGSPLKYAVYNTEDTTQSPISVGHITSNDIGHDITIKDDILVSKTQKYFYIYVWLDGYMTDNTFTDLAFSGSVSASAIQNNNGLPSGYQRVEYLENSGTQYIDTGYIPNYNNNIHIEIISKPSASGVRYCLLSNYSAANHLSLELYNNKGRAYYNNSAVNSIIGTLSTLSENTYIFDYNANNKTYTFAFNNETTSGTMNATGTSGNSMLLFVDQAKRFSTFITPIKIYSLEISENYTILRHMIPAYRKSDGVRGMYDTVNDLFYTNKGSGTFGIGSEI